MIHVLLTSELPWQHNDAIAFFTCLCILGSRVFFFRNRLRELVPSLVASVVAEFEQIPSEHFVSILKQSFKGPKNSE